MAASAITCSAVGLLNMLVPGAFNNATAEAVIAPIEDHRLTRCYRSLGFSKADLAAVVSRCHQARLVRLAVASLGDTAKGLLRLAVYPVNVFRSQLVGEKKRVVASLTHHQNIVVEILLQCVPGLIAGAVFDTADAQTLALAQGVKHQPLVLTYNFPSAVTISPG